MRTDERFRLVLEYFQKHQPVAETELVYTEPYQLVVAVILSAQCTDKRVNMITPPFYRVFPDVDSLAVADPAEVFELIRSCSYPNNKTKNLIAMAKVLVEKYGGILPSDVAELETIPGIGRKTANVLLLSGEEKISTGKAVRRKYSASASMTASAIFRPVACGNRLKANSAEKVMPAHPRIIRNGA